MSTLDYAGFPEQLRAQVPGFDRIYDDHLQDYDEVLPHVLVGELVRFLSDEIRRHGEHSAVLRQAMDLLGRGMGSADPKLQELVAVSFLENLDPADVVFQPISKLFGPRLTLLCQFAACCGRALWAISPVPPRALRLRISIRALARCGGAAELTS